MSTLFPGVGVQHPTTTHALDHVVADRCRHSRGPVAPGTDSRPSHERRTSSATDTILSDDTTLLPTGAEDVPMSRELTMRNGRVTTPDVRLDCSACEGLRDYATGAQAGVYCESCGKRHSKKSLVDVNTPLEGQ